jgi:hypothetical protein
MTRYTQNQLLKDMAADIKMADHAYQLANGSGDLEKIRQAKRFLAQCEADYHTEKKKWFKKQK